MNSGRSVGLVHRLEPFIYTDDGPKIIDELVRCGTNVGDVQNAETCRGLTDTGNDADRDMTLARDTSFCPTEDPFNPDKDPYDPNVNNVTEALRVLDDPVSFPGRHWAYAAFYEPEGWTEENAPKIKGVRRPFPLPCSVFSLNLGPTGPIGLSLLASR